MDNQMHTIQLSTDALRALRALVDRAWGDEELEALAEAFGVAADTTEEEDEASIARQNAATDELYAAMALLDA